MDQKRPSNSERRRYTELRPAERGDYFEMARTPTNERPGDRNGNREPEGRRNPFAREPESQKDHAEDHAGSDDEPDAGLGLPR